MKVWVIFKTTTYGKYEDAFQKMEIKRILSSEEKAQEAEKWAEFFGVGIEIEEFEVE